MGMSDPKTGQIFLKNSGFKGAFQGTQTVFRNIL